MQSREENLHFISKQINQSFNPLHGNITFIDQSPAGHPAISANNCTAKTLPRSIKNGNGNFTGIIFASPEDFKLSASSLSQSSRNFLNSPEFRRNHFNHLSGYRHKLNTGHSFSSNTSADSDSLNRKSPKEAKYLFAKGIRRSTAFHTAELLEKQVCIQLFVWHILSIVTFSLQLNIADDEEEDKSLTLIESEP